MNQQQTQASGVETYYADELVALGMAGQAAILEAQLKAGVPLTYCNEHGDLVQKQPDGTVIVLNGKEDIK